MLFFDGFELAQPTSASKWDAAANINYRTGAGRWAGNSIDFASTNTLSNCQKNLSNLQTTYCGLAIKTESAPSGERVIFGWVDNTTVQVSVTIGADMKVRVYRGTPSTNLLGTSTEVLSLGSGFWHYLEVKVTVDGSVGAVQVKLDGASIITLTGVNTQATANAYATKFVLGGDTVGTGWGAQGFIDDFYLNDTGFLGECRIDGLVPTGAGNSTQWTPSTGSNWQNVDDANNPNNDTDFNSSSTVGQIDSFATSNLPSAVGTVHGVMMEMWARKDDVGTRQVAQLLRMGGVDYPLTTNTMLSTYSIFYEVLTQDPSPAAWTIASVNAMEVGYKMIA